MASWLLKQRRPRDPQDFQVTADRTSESPALLAASPPLPSHSFVPALRIPHLLSPSRPCQPVVSNLDSDAYEPTGAWIPAVTVASTIPSSHRSALSLSPAPAPAPAPSPPPAPPSSPLLLRSASRSPPPLRLFDHDLLYRSSPDASHDSPQRSRKSSPSHEPLHPPPRTAIRWRRRRRHANSDILLALEESPLPGIRRARQLLRSASLPRSSSSSRASSPWRVQFQLDELPPGFFDEPPEYTTKPEYRPPSGLRRRIMGYNIGSEEEYDHPLEVHNSDGSAPTDYPSPPVSPSTSSLYRKLHQLPVVVVPNLLPLATFVHRASAASVSSASFVTSKFGEHTYYRELLDARTDAEFEAVKNRLVKEWTYIGTFLVAKIAVDATVLGYGSGSNFTIHAFSLRVLVISAVSAALGLVVSVWFLFRCWCTNLHAFKVLAEGQNPIYIFFCLTSRLPVLLSLISVGALALVVVVVAYHVFPGAVITLCGGVWVLLNSQYVWRCTLKLSSVARRACITTYSTGTDTASSL